MARLSISLFGTPQIKIDDDPIELETKKATALLAYLAVTKKAQRRDSLVLMLWPDSEQSQGRTILRQTLYSLNKSLGGHWLESDREAISVRDDADLWIDVHQFRELIGSCGAHGHPASETCPECKSPFAAAVSLYCDDFLKGFSLRDSVNFDDWEIMQAENLRREYASALQSLIQCLSDEGNYEQAIIHARGWLALDQLYETAHCWLMQLYAWSGQRAGALRQYQECVRVLKAEVDADPLEETTKLFEDIKSGRVPSRPSALQSSAGTAESVPDREHTSTATSPEHAVDTEEAESPADQLGRLALHEENRTATILILNRSAKTPRPQNGIDVEESFEKTIRQLLATYGGRVDRKFGGVMAVVFGDTRAHESDPEMALRSALEVRMEAQRAGLQIAVGINTGSVHFESGGSALTGRVVNLAIRLSDKAGASQVIAGESTYRLTRNAFDFAPISIKLRGIDEPVTAYRVVGLLPEPMKARGLEGMSAELIGRDQELNTLKSALSEVLMGRGRMVSLMGEAGTGKSRLVSELKAMAGGWRGDEESAPMIWLEGRCVEMGMTVSYWPFIDMLREYFGWRLDETAASKAERISSVLIDLISRGSIPEEAADEIQTMLGNLLSVASDGNREQRLKDAIPEAVRRRTFIAIRDFFVAVSRGRPVLLVFEDLHWADHHSIDLISFFLESLISASIMIVCCYRPEREHRCMQIPTIASRKCSESFDEIVMKDLNRNQSRKMLESILSAESLSPQLKAAILQKSQGNPFFIEEVIRSLIDTEIIFRDGGVWWARHGADDAIVPERVQSLILSRIDLLEPELKGALLAASVVGRLFRSRVLNLVLQGIADLDGLLRELERREIIYEERSIPEVEYSFRHVLTQEAAYESIALEARSRLHLRVADSLESLYQDKLDEQFEQLAFHYDRSGNADKALDYLLKAGEKAKRSSADIQAISHLSRGLSLIGELPESVSKSRKELEFLISMGGSLVTTQGHNSPEVREVYERAHDLCREVGEIKQLFKAVFGLRRFTFGSGAADDGLSLAKELIKLSEEIDEPLYRSRAHMIIGESYLVLGEIQSAAKHAEAGLRAYETQRDSDVFLFENDSKSGGLIFSTNCLWLLGLREAASKRAIEAMCWMRKISSPFNSCMSLYYLSMHDCFCGSYQGAMEKAAEAKSLSVEHNFSMFEGWGSIIHGWSRAKAGNFLGGIDEIRGGRSILQANGAAAHTCFATGLLAEALLDNCEFEEALTLLDQSIEISSKTGENFWRAELYRLKGEALILSGAGDDKVEEKCFEKALGIAGKQHALSLELRAALSLGQLLADRGRGPDAGALLGEVYGRFTEGFDTPDLLRAKAFLDVCNST